ncbi:MAG: hypothetical protein HYR48_05325 [Gemmatimonadetes bacterium]|nr:hypothetical protein [Gemmatimonadota bacterium]
MAALVALAGLGACGGDTVGPEDVDPQALSSDLDAMAATFDNNAAFQSLATLSELFPQYAATAAVRGTLPIRVPAGAEGPGEGLGAAITARLGAARALASLASPRGVLALFPSDVLGKTLVWDEATDQYVVSQTVPGAPANGIRIQLYVVDATTGRPVEPVLQLGYVDLTDESTAQADKLGVLLTLAGTTLADYDISLSRATTTFSLDAAGYVRKPDLTGRVDFDLQNTLNIQSLSGSILYVLNAADGTSVRLEATGSETSATVLFRVSHGGNSIELSGTVTETSLNIDIKYNGTTVATISGSPDNPTFTGVGGRQLTSQELVALLEIFARAGEFLGEFGDAIFRPAEIVFRP